MSVVLFCFSGTSTLFVILVNRFDRGYSHVGFLEGKTSIEECLKEKLPLIPNTKLVIISGLSKIWKMKEIPPETLQVYLRNGLGALLEHLNKRYKSLDLIAVMMELRRTVLIPYDRPFSVYEIEFDDDDWYHRQKNIVQIHENLSCLPRLQKMEQMLEKSDP